MWRSFLPRFPSSGDHRLPVKSMPARRRNNAEKINESARQCEILIHSRSSPRVAPRPTFLLLENISINVLGTRSPPRKKGCSARPAIRQETMALSAAFALHRRRAFAAMRFNMERRELNASLRAVLFLPDAAHASAGKKTKPPSDSGALPFTVTHCLKNYFPSSMPFCTFSFALI